MNPKSLTLSTANTSVPLKLIENSVTFCFILGSMIIISVFSGFILSLCLVKKTSIVWRTSLFLLFFHLLDPVYEYIFGCHPHMRGNLHWVSVILYKVAECIMKILSGRLKFLGEYHILRGEGQWLYKGVIEWANNLWVGWAMIEGEKEEVVELGR